MSNDNPTNKTLEKQLNKIGLSLNSYPNDITTWQKFLLHINNHYEDIEQELYILERSSDISSRETMDLNKKLENAQRLAKMASWQYLEKNNSVVFSRECNRLIDRDPSSRTHKIEHLLSMIHPDDSAIFKDMLLNALNNEEESDCEIRMTKSDNSSMWYYLCCRPALQFNKNDRVVEGIMMDISKRKEAEEKISDLHSRLITTSSTSRYAGMADVSTTILHNLGNVLNSANVSLSLINEKINASKFNKALMAIDLIKSNISSIHKYLLEDEKGKLIPQYLVSLSDILITEQQFFSNEISTLNVQIDHIKNVIAMYQGISYSSGFLENVFLPDLIKDALKMCSLKIKVKNLVINNLYETPIQFETDKVKLLQIIVNLIQNAMEALSINTSSPEITITTHQFENNITISIQDNGIGISPKNLSAIFSFGFTNKPSGHGFGLHSSALFAKQMDGELQVYSAGIGKGSTFTLHLQTMHPLED